MGPSISRGSLWGGGAALLAALLCVSSSGAAAQTPSAQARSQKLKPRVVFTDDPELDDNNTLIRAILYSSDVRVEGLIYASSQFHWRGDGQGTTQYIPGREYTRMGRCPCTSWRFSPNERFIDNIVDAYAKAYPNLKAQDPDYPPPNELKAKIRWGNVDFDGDFSRDTPGSNLIKSLLLDDVPGPLYVTAGGGESTIARALKSIYDQYARTPQWAAVRDKVSRKLIIIRSGDQDGTGASYIAPNWPEVRQYDFSGIAWGYGAQNQAAAEDKVYFTPEWTRQNILSRGPLGALYRVWGDGKQMAPGDKTDYFGLSGYTADQLKTMGYMVWLALEPKGSFLGEGDTPVVLNLVDNGLRAYQNPIWGGWGGWERQSLREAGAASAFGTPPPALPANTSGVARGLAPAGRTIRRPTPPPPPVRRGAAPNFRRPAVPARTAALAADFFAAAENDFAARLQWSVTPKFTAVNHPPVVSIDGPLAISARAGSTVGLKATVSDPDHNSVAVRWRQYSGAETYPGNVTLSDPAALATAFRVPDDAQPGQTIQIILQGTDNGTPALTRYQRVVVTVQ